MRQGWLPIVGLAASAAGGAWGRPTPHPPSTAGPRGALNGARGRSGGGEGFCPQGPARRGASPPWSQIEDLVFQVLTGVGVGDSSAPPTQWDRGNRQVPSGKSHGAGRILTKNYFFGLTRRAGVPAGRGYSRVDRAVDEVICSLIAEDPVEGVLIHRHVTTRLRARWTSSLQRPL
jgi:hypothetical protein